MLSIMLSFKCCLLKKSYSHVIKWECTIFFATKLAWRLTCLLQFFCFAKMLLLLLLSKKQCQSSFFFKLRFCTRQLIFMYLLFNLSVLVRHLSFFEQQSQLATTGYNSARRSCNQKNTHCANFVKFYKNIWQWINAK